MSVRKKRENGANIFFKAVANRFRLTSKSRNNHLCQGITKLFMDDLLLNGLHEKVMICYLK